jgi:hypothetical protein
MRLLSVSFLLFVCHLFGSCASPPSQFRTTKEGPPLVVKQSFDIKVVAGLAKVHHTYTIPAGTYPVYATDSGGTYYWAPRYRIPHKMGSFPDHITGGLYRKNGTTPSYWIFGKAMTTLTIILSGGIGLGEKIPDEYTPLISVAPDKKN